MSVIAYIVARDEGRNLPHVLQALENQTLRPHIVFLDDNSRDDTEEIVRDHDLELFHVRIDHPSLSGRRELGLLWNLVMRRKDPSEFDYWIQCGADVILPENYLEEITGRMIQDKVVISSGVIEGEYSRRAHVRGAGRVYQTSFWNDFIGEYPLIYGWESYPLFKAQALGYGIKTYGDLKMKAIRPTLQVKAEYGKAMSELGYWPLYALGRCLIALARDPRRGAKMLSSYLLGPHHAYDPEVERILQAIQVDQLRNILTHPRRAFRILKERMYNVS